MTIYQSGSAPMISFIICAYNSENTIEKCVRSVLDQTMTDLELIIVDDGSTDATPILCDSFISDPRVKVIHRPNGGVSAARNTGLASASGRYIIWLDSDDHFEPAMGEIMLNAVQRHGTRFAICNYVNYDSKHESVRYPDLKEDAVVDRHTMLEKLARYEISQSVCVSIAERSLYKEIRFPEGQLFEDVRNSYKLIEGSEHTVMVADVLMHRLVRPNSISHSNGIAQRLDGCFAYVERCNDLSSRWPELKPVMLLYDFRHSFRLLRRNIIRSSYRDFRKSADGIRLLCRFYRPHSAEILTGSRGMLRLIWFYLLTSGTYSGFYASRIIERLFNGKNWLENAPSMG